MRRLGYLRALIPNRDGYRLRLLLADGVLINAVVRRDHTGMHYIEGVPITAVVAWWPR